MTIRTDLIDSLLACFASGDKLPAQDFAALSREDAAEIQLAVTKRLSTPVRAVKIGIAEDGSAMLAAIPNQKIIVSGDTLATPRSRLVGLECEVAVRLASDIVSGSGVDVAACISEVLLTIEIIETRLDDRKNAGPWGPFADLMVTGGLVIGPTLGRDLVHPDGRSITVHSGGQRSEFAAKHPFGNALAPLQAFSDRSAPGLTKLPAGCVVTTGSLTPLVAVPSHGGVSFELETGGSIAMDFNA